MYMRVSSLHENIPLSVEEIPGRLQRVRDFLGKVLPSPEQDKPQYDEVTDAAMAVGKTIARYSILSRIGLAEFSAAGNQYTEPYPREKVLEEPMIHDDSSFFRRAQPQTLFSIKGKYYQSFAGETGDNFFVKFGMYPLATGESLIQCSPFEYEGPAYGYEDRAHRQTLAELFPDNSEQLDKHARINLAIIDGEGIVSPLRYFNPQPFGCDFTSILREGSSSTGDEGIHLQVSNGDIQQFAVS
jgi:hypothetical protein